MTWITRDAPIPTSATHDTSWQSFIMTSKAGSEAIGEGGNSDRGVGKGRKSRKGRKGETDGVL